MPPHPDRVRKNYDDPDKGKPIAQQQCKDCGAFGCLIPVPHRNEAADFPAPGSALYDSLVTAVNRAHRTGDDTV